ncbi:hypothetical protein FRC06_003714 [Ceratobasidium sp. 370]|nr:hypothetical protein FRC06_003714 [Ceratobasidium sp. 370]
MAIDVLSTPATSVDVKCAFLYVGSIISKRRHNLKLYAIQATATLGSYSKANLVMRGCLELPCKMNGKEKGNRTGMGTEKVAGKQKAKPCLKDHLN